MEMQEALLATEKFNKASTNDRDTSRWPLWDLWVDGAREMWTSRSNEVAGQLVPKGTVKLAAPNLHKCCSLF